MERYFLKYLKDNCDNELIAKYVDYLKIDLDSYFYANGNEVLNENYPITRDVGLKYYLTFVARYLKSKSAKPFKNRDNNALSLVPFLSISEEECGINLLSPLFHPTTKVRLKEKTVVDFFLLYSDIKKKKFNEVIDNDVFSKFEELKYKLIKLYSSYNFRGLFVGHGEPFIFKYHMEIFRNLSRPSFDMLHGLPGIYNLETEKIADYLLVWGEQIKQNYIDVGFDSQKIIVVGHPKYKKISSNIVLRNSFDDVLVVTTGAVIPSPHGWDIDKFPLYDLGLLVLYCYSVENVLKRIGINQSRLRLHPSINASWVVKYIDTDFYRIDRLPLNESLSKSTVVIGPTSTLLLEAMFAGVNYVVYEPSDEQGTLFKTPLVPPFDNSDANLEVAYSERQLEDMLRLGYKCNTLLLKNYISDFNFSKVVDILLS